MKLKRRSILIALSLILIVGVYITVKSLQVKNQVKELFKLNKIRQEEGYYMADFEFKMLGISYLLDKGEVNQSLQLLDQLSHQLTTTEGLIKMPEFANKEEELDFYLNLQNPKTGAFMDDAFPYNSYHGPTENILIHLDLLAEQLSRPLKLNYRLSYLDEINTPEKLVNYLNDVAFVGPIVAKFPQTTFHNARDIQSFARDDEHYRDSGLEMLFQKHNLYEFSPEWRQTMLKWFYEHQDPETGLWGPKSKDGELLKRDLSNTASIIKNFVNRDGENIHPEFPLRYQDQLFSTALAIISESCPDVDHLDEFHEWNLRTSKGISMLMKYLWLHASEENKQKARTFIKEFVHKKYELYYLPSDGAFSYYPNSKHATLDGTSSGFFLFKKIGAFSGKLQKKLWGGIDKTLQYEKSLVVDTVSTNHLEEISSNQSLNSLRVYKGLPNHDNLASDVAAVIYPGPVEILDVIDLSQNVTRWVESTSQSMGNWVSREELHKRIQNLNVKQTPIHKNEIPLDQMNAILKNNGRLIVIGFDELQIPIAKLEFEYRKS